MTRPASPVPGISLKSRPCSAAILRTSGVERRRSRSSAVSTSPLLSATLPARDLSAAGRAAGAGVAEAGGGAGAAFGGAGAAGAAAGSGAGADAAGAGADAAGPSPRLGAAFAAPAAASVSIRATTVCTATVWPSCTRISLSTPAAGAGISASTLSVEISKIGSSRLTDSPTFLIQRESVPSAMDSPIWGMITSIVAIL